MSEPSDSRMNNQEYRRLVKLSKEELIGLLFASRFGREFTEARVKELQEELEKSKHAFNPYPGRALRGE
jgi:hypothetical protein